MGQTFPPLPFAARVRLVREGLGMTQPQFAEHIGVSVQLVRNWEHRESCPYSPKAHEFLKLEETFLVGMK